MNSIFYIEPYLQGPVLVFDDEERGLSKEPFVSGADQILISFADKMGAKKERFGLLFSSIAFKGHDAFAERESGAEVDGEFGTNYKVSLGKKDMHGWLCPALLKYFPKPPERIYFKIVPIGKVRP